MAAFAARMVDQVLPQVPVRQWVLTLPWDLRLLLAWRHDLPRGVLRIAFRVVQRFYSQEGPEARRAGVPLPPQCATVDGLNLHAGVVIAGTGLTSWRGSSAWTPLPVRAAPGG
jgi:hypothetical protein